MASGGKIERLMSRKCEEDCEKVIVSMLDDMKRQLGQPLGYGRRKLLKFTAYLIFLATLLSIFNVIQRPTRVSFSGFLFSNSQVPLIVVITPTYKRTTRLADMTRMANTLMHINDVHWIVIEDGEETYPYVTSMLNRTKLKYTYMAVRTTAGYPRKGWYQRNQALNFVRQNIHEIFNDHKTGVLYFGDDDNAYDIRLFDEYIRKVKKLGMWAVGLVGGTAVESPRVVDGKVTGFNVKWNPNRVFATDMAGFAINLNYVINSTAEFPKNCQRGLGSPETCLLQDMGFTREDIEPFGFDQTIKKELLVWHTKTKQPQFDPKRIDTYGYIFEFSRNDTVGIPVKKAKKKHSGG